MHSLSFAQFLTLVIADMAKAICQRPDEPKDQQLLRVQLATHLMLGLRPRDGLEAMYAGHAVMFHSLLTDSAHQTLRGEVAAARRGTRANVVALDRCFHQNLDRLERCQTRLADGTREAAVLGQQSDPAADAAALARAAAAAMAPAATATSPAPATTPASDTAPVPASSPSRGTSPAPATTPAPVTSATTLGTDIAPAVNSAASRPAPAAPVPAPAPVMVPEDIRVFQPTPEQIAAVRHNPTALQALLTGDPERLAHAMGVELARPTQQQLATIRANPEAMAALAAGDAERFGQIMSSDPSPEAWPVATTVWTCSPGRSDRGRSDRGPSSPTAQPPDRPQDPAGAD